MTRFILDTDHLSLFESAHPAVTRRIQAQPPGELAITVISVEEQLTGWYSVLRSARRRDQVASAYRRLAAVVPLLADFPILPFPEPAILRFDALRALRLNVGTMDLRIAAIALEAGCSLVTRNARDFGRVPGLLIVDWSR